jgi:hypothetical protein
LQLVASGFCFYPDRVSHITREGRLASYFVHVEQRDDKQMAKNGSPLAPFGQSMKRSQSALQLVVVDHISDSGKCRSLISGNTDASTALEFQGTHCL